MRVNKNQIKKRLENENAKNGKRKKKNRKIHNQSQKRFMFRVSV